MFWLRLTASFYVIVLIRSQAPDAQTVYNLIQGCLGNGFVSPALCVDGGVTCTLPQICFQDTALGCQQIPQECVDELISTLQTTEATTPFNTETVTQTVPQTVSQTFQTETNPPTDTIPTTAVTPAPRPGPPYHIGNPAPRYGSNVHSHGGQQTSYGQRQVNTGYGASGNGCSCCNRQSDCTLKANRGMCVANYFSMLANCPKACNFCPPSRFHGFPSAMAFNRGHHHG